ncbi:protease modulator HflC [Candidatus Albibeggiatoa sp. nov. NOAA]|uniref:protease modulator HflC n=1 Tax=Candidatus Albibeggiatoa sp. nov. NOAA TaxID=3162724 RepID=UPI0033029551|nr:protease modulator HflC [Thiotrichaceae bacterium]
MSASKMLVLSILMVLVTIGLMSVFIVKQTELALRLQLGQVVAKDYEPGLHFKFPLIQNVRKFDRRVQTLDARPEQFLTSEKKNLIVDSYIKWRIVDVETYFTSTSGSDLMAGQRLSEIIADGLRSEFGKRSIQDVVSGDRSEIMDIITEEADSRAQKFGISIVDVRIKRIELPTEVRSSVHRRMEAERERVAKQLRSQGEAEGTRIRAKADRESTEIIATAKRNAEIVRGEGDAKAAETYATAYTKNSEFYALYRSLNAYKETFNNQGDVMLIKPDSEFFNYFKSTQGATVAE